MEKLTVYNSRNLPPRLMLKFDQPSRTKQSFKDEVNINNIMSKYQKTGLLAHVNNNAPQYGEVSPIEFREALDIIRDAEQMFSELPAQIRKKFGNNPEAFLDFTTDPENRESMNNMGLLKEKLESRSAPPQELQPPPKTDEEATPTKSDKD